VGVGGPNHALCRNSKKENLINSLCQVDKWGLDNTDNNFFKKVKCKHLSLD
jgi:hypothetical protein